ncbi:LIM domain only protein 7-like [Syngnathus acus]|uniref:LIM domain only protein 7-like n=1 Tax=Syngnathus acus TaxID=161584 RepID=UPI00188629FC|nr:LIM domain only protein 7-like [Syngnathus acus]
MEWRQQSTFSCADAFNEAQRWIEEVTGKGFGCSDFRAALENGVLLCDLINQLKPGIIKKLNRQATPIAGLDNINVFLKACGKVGLNESQLFHPGDLQDLSSRAIVRRKESGRRLKNVLITVYWLGRKAYLDDCYNGAQLNFKAFEGLLGLALSKALDDGGNVKDRECVHPGGPIGHTREASLDSLDSADSRAPRANSEGCGSDAEAEQVFKMETAQQSTKGEMPPPVLRRKQKKDNGKVSTSFTSVLCIRSKSLSDIPTVQTSRKVSQENARAGQDTSAGKWNQDKKWRSHSASRDSEVRWQDALTRWKNHRKNVKSNLRRESLDREGVMNTMNDGAENDLERQRGAQLERQVNFQSVELAAICSGSSERPPPSLVSLHAGKLEEQLSAQRHCPASVSPPSNFSSAFLRTHGRAPLTRSYAAEVPFSPASSSQNFPPAHAKSGGVTPASDGNVTGEETRFASLALNGAAVTAPTRDNALGSHSRFNFSAPVDPRSDASQPEKVHTSQLTFLGAADFPNDGESGSSVAFRDLSDPKALSGTESHENASEMSGDKSRCESAEGRRNYLSRAASWSCSASLPRAFKRAEGSCRVSSVITARPFGTKQSRIPKLCHSLTGVGEGAPSSPASATLKRQTASSYLRGPHQHPNHVAETTLAKAERTSLSRQSFRSQQYSKTQAQLGKAATLPRSASVGTPKVDHRDLSLVPIPNSGPDCVFQPLWETTDARRKCCHAGGPADFCRLCADDAIPTVRGDLAARLSSDPWEDKMASALQIGTLTADSRRYEKKGGSESAISDLQVPSLTRSSSSWSWDHEGDHRRQQKWQEEQERLLQAQYERDRRRLQAEWQKAKEDAREENNFGVRDDVETPPGVTHLHGLTKINERSPEELGFKRQNGTRKDLNNKDWAEGTSGFAGLSPAHRAKSLSTPALAESYKQPKGDQRKRKEDFASKAEQERQQILEEMKKRTQLLTDNSWIRQRTSAFYKEPIYIGLPLKRYESLDTLGSARSTLMAADPRPHSATAGFCGAGTTSSARYSNGSRSSLRNPPTDPHSSRMDSGRRTCCVCEGHLSSGAAMVIEELNLSFHFACFQCVGCQRYLGKTDTGVQVRVRNKKPYCEPCYFQLKSTTSAFV